MFGFRLKSAIIAAVLLGTASVALAADSTIKGNAQKAFDLLATYSAETSEPDYIKLQSFLSPDDVSTIEAELTKRYGASETNREGLKVWEITHPNPKRGHTTIMCGPDGKGGVHISADRRRMDTVQSSESSQKEKRQTNSQSRPTPSISFTPNGTSSAPQVE